MPYVCIIVYGSCLVVVFTCYGSCFAVVLWVLWFVGAMVSVLLQLCNFYDPVLIYVRAMVLF